MITIDGRRVLSRRDIHQRHGYALSTLERWWAQRNTNGHPDAVRLHGTLYWYEDSWEAWDKKRRTPEGMLTRAELAEKTGYTIRYLEQLWRERNTNGHPPGTRIGGRLRWNAEVWDDWNRNRLQIDDVEQPAAHDAADDDLIGPAEFSRILGHADTSTVSKAVKTPPPGWPEPDEWEDLPSGRKRPKWRRWRALAYRDHRADRPIRRGRRPGSRNARYPYAGDPRLTLARQLLAERSDATNAELIDDLQRRSDPPPSSYSTWTKILTSARSHPQEEDD
ncbi:hypothetical protein [Streptomyces synnematoformans]|uniref:DNA-binding protein n=1 Tax=Streptomyces synnematoformans TaxID=415721 RepID=A0ABN2XFB4_9ACTN